MLSHHLAHAGYGAIALAIGLETAGFPFLPGETTLLAAAAFAGSEQGLHIGGVIGSAIGGGIVGGIVGYAIGRALGFRLLLRYGPRIGVTPRRLKLGMYLFGRYGGAVIFVARFVALLRSLASFLAGATRMRWGRFLLYNALSAAVWAGLYGYAAFALGKQIKHLAGPVGAGIGLVVLILVVTALVSLRRRENLLADEAERAMPGPLENYLHWRDHNIRRHQHQPRTAEK